MFQILPGFPDDVLAVSASGRITAADYDEAKRWVEGKEAAAA